MKRKLLAVMMVALAMSFTACGNKSDDAKETTTKNVESVVETQDTKDDAADETKDNDAVASDEVNDEVKDDANGEEASVTSLFSSADSGSHATFTIDSSVKMDDESAWLGLCPAGKDYITEVEADEVDVVYFYADARESDSAPYVFACDFEDVEDGEYALVVNTSDDENVGYVVLQIPMEKKGDSLTLDYTKGQLRERP